MSTTAISPRRWDYQRQGILAVLVLLALAGALTALCLGATSLSWSDIVAFLTGKGSAQTNRILWNIRMPRVMTAFFGGLGLASVGCVMQGVLRNPLASASTLGISQGAAFGAAMAIICFDAGYQGQVVEAVTIVNPWLVSLCAFICALGATLAILGLSAIRFMTPEAMILAGVALSSLFAGGTTLLQYFADDVKLSAVVFWTFGDLGRTSWREVTIMASISLAALGYFICNRWNYNVLLMGDSSALSMGVEVSHLRLAAMTICALTSAVIVSFMGVINFIGLVAPHLMRRFVGNDYRYLLPASALTGALLLLAGDLVTRLALAPVILPIGAVTSFLGAPLFLYLLFKRSAR